MFLINQKWVKPIITEINTLPNEIIKTLIMKITELSKKYETTYTQISHDAKQAKKDLAISLQNLVGSEFDIKGINAFVDMLNDGM